MKDIKTLLKLCNVGPHLLGYYVLEYLIERVANKFRNKNYNIAYGKLLREYAEAHNTTYARAERAARHAITYAFAQPNEWHRRLFKNTVYRTVTPQLSLFVATLAEFLNEDNIDEEK